MRLRLGTNNDFAMFLCAVGMKEGQNCGEQSYGPRAAALVMRGVRVCGCVWVCD